MAHRTCGELGSALLGAGISLSPMFPDGACTQLWLSVSFGQCLCSGRPALAKALDSFLWKYNRFQFMNVPVRSPAVKEEEPSKSGHSAPCSPKVSYLLSHAWLPTHFLSLTADRVPSRSPSPAETVLGLLQPSTAAGACGSDMRDGLLAVYPQEVTWPLMCFPWAPT